MEIQTSAGGFADADVQGLAVAVFKDERADEGLLKELDAAAGGLITSVLESEELKGKEGESAYLHLPAGAAGTKAKRLLLVGVGDRADYRAAQVSQFAGAAVRALRSRNVKTVGLVPRFEGDAAAAAAAAVEGAVIGLFEPDKYRTIDKEERSVERLVVIHEGAGEEDLRRGAERGRVVGESVNFTRDLSNEPGAYMTPTIMAERAQEIANQFGLEIDVLDQARMEQEGMGALLSVARGSDEPPKMMVLTYMPEGKQRVEDGEDYLA
ncbi:MAG TPA: M17 family peptidase N-terminal domain-containing protein, partial [Pyrinomonadaceae bacterium]